MLREVKNMRMFNSVRSAYCAVLLKGMAILWLIAVNATTLVRASPMRSVIDYSDFLSWVRNPLRNDS